MITIQTFKGPINLKADTKYSLESLVNLNPQQLQPFYDLFGIDLVSVPTSDNHFPTLINFLLTYKMLADEALLTVDQQLLN